MRLCPILDCNYERISFSFLSDFQELLPKKETIITDNSLHIPASSKKKIEENIWMFIL